MNNAVPQLPKAISMSAIVSVENALWEIPRGISELLEPLGYTESHLFAPELLHQLRRLGRKLQDTSSTVKQSISRGDKRRHFFSSQSKNTSSDLNLFAEGFHLVLDEFRVGLSRIGVISYMFLNSYYSALPSDLSTMEAAVRSLGIASNSSCALLPFLDWVVQSRRVMDHRFGLIRTVRFCYRGYRVSRSQRGVHDSNPSAEPQLREYELLHVGLLNARGIENWLEIEIMATSIRGAVASPFHPILVGDPGQSMTELARWIEDGIQWALNAGGPVGFSSNVHERFVLYSREGVEPPRNRLYDHLDKLKGSVFGGLLTDGEVSREDMSRFTMKEEV
ncbi:hypothetical protein BS47DRAFT_1361056 [Hydnum rufescens UP504]|uniref:Uncharacterized protein n=1 Tax=Hydnum rufescens UP504 TaxID=1448309 RepID=A0A9P6B0B2_9AGAM|nr:hypothetical protein BS47DRAFT_1361056 [Hydnum rufescens UP504]